VAGSGVVVTLAGRNFWPYCGSARVDDAMVNRPGPLVWRVSPVMAVTALGWPSYRVPLDFNFAVVEPGSAWLARLNETTAFVRPFEA